MTLFIWYWVEIGLY